MLTSLKIISESQVKNPLVSDANDTLQDINIVTHPLPKDAMLSKTFLFVIFHQQFFQRILHDEQYTHG